MINIIITSVTSIISIGVSFVIIINDNSIALL